ncbi:TetR/AcrR family transcriptional regulator [Hydrogenophaga laconesensis]|uniref:AcrR family transcriptional regulator n=1 Tax=Hydrogenophaga laconesensis TaxID=1805971 RepID=A0ABU1V773_9BURK|nr:TetR/AcrR family transcriptional regulator [Hydrogenophaga laconesensis]MDR7093103.1 AcrR family transcriptional regulator [Hydrogenophaga laconesensis]
MARSLASNHDDKRQRILDVAAALFASTSYESARLVDIAAACNVSKSALYHYFPSKEVLLYVIISEHIMSSVAELETIAHGSGSSRERLTSLVRAMVKRAAEKRHEHMVLTNDLKFLPALQQQEIKLAQAKALDFVVELLNDINPHLMRRRREGASYALFLYGSMISTATWYRRGGGMTPHELADRLTEVFLKGFDGGDHPPGYR